MKNIFAQQENQLDVELDNEGKRVLFYMNNPSSGFSDAVKEYLSQVPNSQGFSHNQFLGKVWGWIHGYQGVVVQFQFSDGSTHASVVLDVEAPKEAIRESLTNSVAKFFGQAVAKQLVSLKEGLDGKH